MTRYHLSVERRFFDSVVNGWQSTNICIGTISAAGRLQTVSVWMKDGVC